MSQHPWTGDRLRLFISHSSADKLAVAELKEELASVAIEGFVAHADIRPSSEWIIVIEQALRTCQAFTAVLTESFISSEWTDQEAGWAMCRDVPIVALKYARDPHGFLARYQALPVQGDMAQVAARIFDILMSDARTAPDLSRAVVRKFRASSSFIEARATFDLVTKATALTSDLVDVIEAAPHLNDQIGSHFTLPQMVPAFVARARQSLR